MGPAGIMMIMIMMMMMIIITDHMGPAEFLPSNWLVDLMADYGCGDQVHWTPDKNIFLH